MEEAARPGFRMGLRTMVVDDNPTCLKIITTMLAALHFIVQPFKTAVEALCSLREQKEEFDLVLIDVRVGKTGSTSLTSFKLMDHIVKETDISVITMCADDDHKILCESLSHGASFHFTKPMTTAVVEVMRQKVMQKNAKRDMITETVNKHNMAGFPGERNVSAGKRKLGLGFYGVVGPRRSIQMTDNLFCYLETSSGDESGKGENPRRNGSGSKKPRMGRLLWDSDLHQRFLTSVELLGQHAVPRKILELMNVDGLTVKQVSSHLQKHRTRQGNPSRRLMQNQLRQGGQSRKQRKMMSFRPSQKPQLRPLLPKIPSAMEVQCPPMIWTKTQPGIPQSLQHNPIHNGGNMHLFLNSQQTKQEQHGESQNMMLANCSYGGIQYTNQQHMLLNNSTSSETQFSNFVDPAMMNWGSSSSHQLPVNIVHPSSSNDSTKVFASGDNSESFGSDRGSSTAHLQGDQLQDDSNNSLCLERALRKAFDIPSDDEDSSPDNYITLAEFIGLEQGGGALEKEGTDENSCMEGKLDEKHKESSRKGPMQEQAPHNMDDYVVPEVSQKRDEPQSSQMGEDANKGSSSKNIVLSFSSKNIVNENSDSFDIERFNLDNDFMAEIFEEINTAEARAP